MRFSSILFALPLIGSVLSAPVASPEPAVPEVVKRDVDVISILADVEAKIKAIVPTGALTVQADIEANVNVVIGELNHCLDLLSVNADIAAAVGIHAKRDLESSVNLVTRDLDVNAVAQILVSITASVNTLVGFIPAEMCKSGPVSGLISTCDGLLVKVFVGIKVLLPNLLNVCASLFVSLHININVYLSACINLVGGLIVSLGGVVGGLVGGLLGGNGGGLLGGLL